MAQGPGGHVHTGCNFLQGTFHTASGDRQEANGIGEHQRKCGTTKQQPTADPEVVPQDAIHPVVKTGQRHNHTHCEHGPGHGVAQAGQPHHHAHAPGIVQAAAVGEGDANDQRGQRGGSREKQAVERVANEVRVPAFVEVLPGIVTKGGGWQQETEDHRNGADGHANPLARA